MQFLPFKILFPTPVGLPWTAPLNPSKPFSEFFHSMLIDHYEEQLTLLPHVLSQMLMKKCHPFNAEENATVLPFTFHRLFPLGR